MGVWVATMETGGSTLARYLDDNGDYQQPDIVFSGGSQGVTDPAIPAGTPATVNQNPYFDPNTNIVPGKDIPLKGTTTAAPTTPTATSPDYSTPAGISAYYASRGVSPFPTSVDYWVGKWNEWGKNDPAYFQSRLAQADEFTGVGPNYDWQAAGKADPGTSAAGAAAPAAVAASVAPPAAVAPQESEFIKYLRELIKSRLTAASSPVDPNAENIAAPLTAARDEATRASDQERTDTAERLYAQGGLNTNALNQTIQQSAERNAGSLSTLRGTLIMNAYNQKNQELQSLLQMALASGDAQSARDVQAQIANLNAEIQREGLGVTLAINTANQNANTVNSALG